MRGKNPTQTFRKNNNEPQATSNQTRISRCFTE